MYDRLSAQMRLDKQTMGEETVHILAGDWNAALHEGDRNSDARHPQDDPH